MIRRRWTLWTVGILFLSLSWGCDYGRMYDQDVIKTYGREVPKMDPRTAPIEDGFHKLANADPGSLENPLPYSNASLERGARAYGYYCIQCHGPNADGNGTVGQSFTPLPADLASPSTISQKDGELYAKVRLGFKRHPVLFSTVSARDGWAMILYLRSVRR
jgi:mono/diheme cytochrome c family protein